MIEAQAMTIRLPKNLYEELRRAAFERHVSMTSLITDAVAAYLDTR